MGQRVGNGVCISDGQALGAETLENKEALWFDGFMQELRFPSQSLIGTEFGEGGATKQRSVQQSASSVNANEGQAFSE